MPNYKAFAGDPVTFSLDEGQDASNFLSAGTWHVIPIEPVDISATVTVVVAPFVAGGTTENSTVEGATAIEYEIFDADDGDGGTDPGLITGGRGPYSAVKNDGDPEIIISGDGQRLVVDRSVAGVFAIVFTGTDADGETVQMTFTVTVANLLGVSTNGDEGTVEVQDDEIIDVAYDGPGVLYDGTYPLNLTLVTAAPPRLWATTAGPKLDGGRGYSGLWYNDLEVDANGNPTNVMTLTYDWLDGADAVVASGTVDPSTDWTVPGGATVLRITATDSYGSTVSRSDDEVGNQAPAASAKALNFYVPIASPGANTAPSATAKALNFYVPIASPGANTAPSAAAKELNFYVPI